jgi:hypothetical protein
MALTIGRSFLGHSQADLGVGGGLASIFACRETAWIWRILGNFRIFESFLTREIQL